MGKDEEFNHPVSQGEVFNLLLHKDLFLHSLHFSDWLPNWWGFFAQQYNPSLKGKWYWERHCRIGSSQARAPGRANSLIHLFRLCCPDGYGGFIMRIFFVSIP